MDKGKLQCLLVLAGCVFIINFAIWAGIYFGIYYPLLNKDWHRSLCVVTDVEQYQTGFTVTHLYTQYKLGVMVEGRVLPGYACESSENRSDITSNNEDAVYPYQYPECAKAYVQHGLCRPGQLFLPRWMCIGFKGIAQYQEGDVVECQYYVNGSSGAQSFSYPQKGADFIEVIFMNEVFIPQGDYIALWVIPFGLLSMLPCAILIFCCGPKGLGWCSDKECAKYKDCFERFVCCRRKEKPRLLRKYGHFMDKIEPKPILVWLFSIKKQPEAFPFKHNVVQEIADYLA